MILYPKLSPLFYYTRNLFLKNNMIKIGDLGIARVFDDNSKSSLASFESNYQYMSPEAMAKKKYGRKTDLW